MNHHAYALAADVAVAVHFGWILFLIGGAAIGRRVLWVRTLHLAGLGYSVLLQLNGWICPLTDLELWLRTRGGTSAYSGSFVAHYFERLVYLEVEPAWVLLATGAIVGGSVAVYLRRPADRARG